MEKVNKGKENAYNDGKNGILYLKSHPDYEINRMAYMEYKIMVVNPILVKTIDDLLR